MNKSPRKAQQQNGRGRRAGDLEDKATERVQSDKCREGVRIKWGTRTKPPKLEQPESVRKYFRKKFETHICGSEVFATTNQSPWLRARKIFAFLEHVPRCC